MASPTQTPGLVPWNALQARLAGAFEAHAHGLLRVSYTLTNRNGNPFAGLRARDGGAALTAGDLEAGIHQTSRGGYRMLSQNTELVRATPLAESAATLRIECAGRVYEARLRLLRNVAVVRVRDGGEIVRLSGGLAGRRYEAVFDPEIEGALLVAVLVLHHASTLRRRIYLAG